MLPATFTVAQANALVPYLTDQFEKTRKLSDELRMLRSRTRITDRARRPLGSDRLQAFASSDVLRRLEEVERALRAALDETTSLGIEVRRVDGLVDFPAWLEGQLVYLCWRFGEKEIGFYHPITTGFEGRRAINQTKGPELN